jgi:uncharacterized protein involved in exopolysaccharide biosynthesis
MSEPLRAQKNAAAAGQDDELSMFQIGAILARHRWRIARWTILGGLVAALTVIGKSALYRAAASFSPYGASDRTAGGLATLAGQFGVTIPGTSQTLSPDYYVKLLRSRTLLRRVVHDTFTVAELGGRRVAFFDLFEVNAPSPLQREDKGIDRLNAILGAAPSKTTNIVEVSASTKWRSVSLAIVSALMEGVNDFNQHSQQEQAKVEREFIEGRLGVASRELAAAEDQLDEFYKSNRSYQTSPDLVTRRDRLQRVVNQRQQVYGSLAQSYEESRLREVRDTPLITIVETPWAPALPEPRGRTKVALLGVMVGGFIGVFLVLSSASLHRRIAAGDTDVIEFREAMRALGADLARPARWPRAFFGRKSSSS